MEKDVYEWVQKPQQKHLKTVLDKMANMVGLDTILDADLEKQDWYTRHTWTEETNDKFKDWMVNYLYENNKARKNLLNHNVKSKKMIREAVEWFMLDYSWKIEEDEE